MTAECTCVCVCVSVCVSVFGQVRGHEEVSVIVKHNTKGCAYILTQIVCCENVNSGSAAVCDGS